MIGFHGPVLLSSLDPQKAKYVRDILSIAMDESQIDNFPFYMMITVNSTNEQTEVVDRLSERLLDEPDELMVVAHKYPQTDEEGWIALVGRDPQYLMLLKLSFGAGLI